MSSCLLSRIVRYICFDSQTNFGQRCGKWAFEGVLCLITNCICCLLFGIFSAMPNRCNNKTTYSACFLPFLFGYTEHLPNRLLARDSSQKVRKMFRPGRTFFWRNWDKTIKIQIIVRYCRNFFWIFALKI